MAISVADAWAEVKRRLTFIAVAAADGVCTADQREADPVPCPFHDEKIGSFVIYDDHGHCFGCGWHGDIFDFWTARHGGEPIDVLLALAEMAGIEVERSPEAAKQHQAKRDRQDVLRSLCLAAWKVLWHGLDGQNPRDWLDFDRGLDLAVCRKIGVGYIPPGQRIWPDGTGDLARFFSGCLLFPHRRAGRVTYVTSRALEGKGHRKLRRDDWGPAPRVWYPDAVPTAKAQLLLVEGELDGLSALATRPDGWVVGAVLGVGARPDDLIREFPGAGPIVSLLDRDAAGEAMTRKLGRTIPGRLRVPAIGTHPAPAGGDLNDALQVIGAEALTPKMADAVAMSIPYVEALLAGIKGVSDQAAMLDLIRADIGPALAALSETDPIAADLHVSEVARRAKIRVSSIRKLMGQAAPSSNGGPPSSAGPTSWEGCEIPPGWLVQDGSLWRCKYSKGGEVAGTFLVCDCIPRVRTKYRDEQTGDLSFELSWKRGGRGWSLVSPASSVLIPSRLQEMSDQSLPVHGANSRDLSLWFADWERVNHSRIAIQRGTTRYGWHGRETSFLLGPDVIGEPDDAPIFTGHSVGEQQTHKAMSAGGDAQTWFSHVLSRLQQFPMLALVVASTCAAPLVRLTGCGSFILGLESGQSSVGKTRAMRVGESVFGRPGRAGIEKRFMATETALERYMWQMCDLPTYIDDTQGKSRFLDPIAILYMATDGQGKSRGEASRTGRRGDAFWYTATTVTGEIPLEDYSPNEGVAARIIGVNVSPFGEIPVKEIVDDLDMICKENYGHGGRTMLRWLLAQPQWQRLVRDKYDEHRKEMSAVWSGHPTMSRRANYAATIRLAADIAGRAWPWPESGLSFLELVDEALHISATGATARDAAADAMEQTQSWVAANRFRFYSVYDVKKDSTVSMDPREWFGIAYEDGRIAIFRSALEEMFVRKKIGWLSVLREWRRRRWINTPYKGYTQPVRVRDFVGHAIVIQSLRTASDDSWTSYQDDDPEPEPSAPPPEPKQTEMEVR